MFEDLYGTLARTYDAHTRRRAVIVARILDAQLSLFRGGIVRVLDVGIGTALVWQRICHRWDGLRVCGVDQSQAMLASAKRKSLAFVDLVQGSGDALPLRPRTFHMITAAFVLKLFSPIPNPGRSAAEA